MMQHIMLGNLLRAARFNPAARPCAIWQPATDSAGAAIFLPDGSAQWEKVGEGFAIFTFDQPDKFAGTTGDYAGDFKVNVITKPKTMGEADQPSLARTFLVQNLTEGFDPFPRWTVATQLDAMASNGLIAKYHAREAEISDLSGIPGA